MEFKDINFKQKLVFILCGLSILFSVLSILETETDFSYLSSRGLELIKAGALTAKPATIESTSINSNSENNLINLLNADVVYLEYKVIVFYKSNGSLYYFGVPYESEKISILRPFDDREEVVEKVNLIFSKYDNSKSFEENIEDNLKDISIIYRGYVDNNPNLFEFENNSEPNPIIAPPPTPIITENADGTLILSIDETGWVSVSDVIIINYGYDNPAEPYKVVLPKDSLVLRKMTDKNDIIYVESTKLSFSQIDSEKDLQENIDSYLIGVSVEYPKIITPPPY